MSIHRLTGQGVEPHIEAEAGLTPNFAWRDIGADRETNKPKQLWLRAL